MKLVAFLGQITILNIVAMKKLLIVDDDEDLLDMVTMMLEASHYQVRKLTDPSCVIKAIDQERPDMIILDIFMGAVDGRELCRTLKNMEEYRSIPIILYSAGHISQATILHSKADDFLPKAFEMAELVGLVKKTLENSKDSPSTI